jgi:hypothetical protein
MAGVWRVAAELALRGIHPHFPGVDYGYDLIVDGGVRIQVKCAHLSMRKGQAYKGGAYWFKLAKQPIVVGTNSIKKRLRQVFSEKNDFVVLWGIEQDRFWVVPAATLDNHQLVVVGPDVAYKRLDQERIVALYESGHTQQEIADMMGVHQYTISERLRGKWVVPKRAISEQVRNCENRWDLIEGCIQSLTEAESIPGVAEAEAQGVY